ncbi:putative microtubule-severing ATPase [Helianthus annuus]|uniref:microtubule-severing ATPase n=1 Tax=Helianthus annuus TaxID=4232 RepID=A0A251SXI3_HELAN|nr:spastin [Helianthus annuus]KAF5775856.1 putative microtubule-severing ATPase [Helianthus annuus]
MSFFKELIDNFNSYFTNSPSDTSNQNPSSSNNSSYRDRAAMEGVENERAAYKLKGYFDLAKEQIDKAVRAEEWGLVDDAVLHYQNAQRILGEAMATPVPSYISSREQEKVKSYRQKISKWQGQVSERLSTLNSRSGSTSINKKTSPQLQTNLVSPSRTNATKVVSQKSSGPSVHGAMTPNRSNKPMNSKPVQELNGGLDPKLVEMINSVIVDRSPSVKWEDIAGLEKAKQALLEMVILPAKRKDLFTGLRRPAKGLLLFGPPGTGKTMLAKAVASESQATFFSISASSLTSKWVGEGEKLVRTLFAVAVSRQPSVIFMDEIDSVMSARTSNEHDASRRLKSEFLVQFDGVTSNSNDLVIVIGATNKPQELDDAVLRRLVKRIYIPLPDANSRRNLLKNKLKGQQYSLPSGDLERLVKDTEGYSGSDLQALCEEAAMMPIRELGSNILTVKADQVRRLQYGDFRSAMTVIRPSIVKSKWEELEQWNKEFGSN